jgi:hypothetical protein
MFIFHYYHAWYKYFKWVLLSPSLDKTFPT